MRSVPVRFRASRVARFIYYRADDEVPRLYCNLAILVNNGGGVGEASYQGEISRIVGGRVPEGHKHICEAVLVPEPDNPYDENAVRVEIGRRTVGYLSSADNRDYLAALRVYGLDGKPAACWAQIIGGWDDGDGDRGSFGVKLSLKWPCMPAMVEGA